MTGPLVLRAGRVGAGWTVAAADGTGPTVPPAVHAALTGTDLGEAWIVPGLVDAHRHLPHSHTPTSGSAIARARDELVRALGEKGVLGVTDMGAADVTPWPDRPPGVRSAICGLEGPSRWPRPSFAMLADTPAAAEGAVATLAEAGATHTKIFATASGRLPRQDAISATISPAAFRAAMRRADELRLATAVHCHGGPTLGMALDAGVASLEHGLYFSKADLRLVAAAGARLVMTPLVYIRRRGETMRVRMRELFEDAREAGVPVLLGTDSDSWLIADEVVAMVDLGLDPGAVLACVTPPNEPSVLGTHGALVLDADPRADPTTLLRPVAVIPRGSRS